MVELAGSGVRLRSHLPEGELQDLGSLSLELVLALGRALWALGRRLRVWEEVQGVQRGSTSPAGSGGGVCD